MKKSIFTLIILSIVLTACNLPRRASTPSPEEVETQVNILLTTIPTLTQMPSPTKAAATATVEPTAVVATTAAPTTAPTLAATATPVSPTSTPQQSDPRVSLGEPTRKDAMNDGGGFFTYSDDHVKFDPQDESMLMIAYETDSWHGWSLSGTTLKDAYIEMTAKPGSCAGADRYGLMVRAPDSTRGYFFGFSCDGRYSFRKWDGKVFTDIVDWTSSDKILSGSDQTNRVGIKTIGSHFTFYANGFQIGEADDASYAEGKMGLFIAASSTSNFSVTVDEVDYWTIQ